MGEKIEIWRHVVAFETFYEVSNFGRIKSLSRTVSRLSRSGKPINVTFKPLFKKFDLNRDGYYYVSLHTISKRKNAKVHRIVADAFLNPVDGKTHIDHIDGNKLNNSDTNLRWCTHAENIQFAWESGLYNNIGSSHGMSKLSESDAIEIKALIKQGDKNYLIAKRFGISQQTVCDIRKGRLWNHV